MHAYRRRNPPVGGRLRLYPGDEQREPFTEYHEVLPDSEHSLFVQAPTRQPV